MPAPRLKTCLSLLSLALLCLAACSDKSAGGAPAAPGAAPAIEVDVISVGKSDATLTRELPASLEAVRRAEVRARVEGIVNRRNFTEGSDVKAGKSLFSLDARTFRANVEAADADLALTRLTLQRYQRLLADKAVSEQDYELLQVKLKQAEANLAKARLDMENANVTAPISGRAGRAMVTEGALVGRGEATLLTVIEQLDPIFVNFSQSSEEMQQMRQLVKQGNVQSTRETRVRLLFADGSAYPLPGKLIFSDWSVDPATGSIQMRAQFPNPQHELLPGAFMRIQVPQAQMAGVIRVPQRAVQMDAQGAFVLTLDKQQKVVNTPIKLLHMAGSDWVVGAGMQVGDQVIVQGLQKVRPGMQVKPVNWQAEPNAAAHTGKTGAVQGGTSAQPKP